VCSWLAPVGRLPTEETGTLEPHVEERFPRNDSVYKLRKLAQALTYRYATVHKSQSNNSHKELTMKAVFATLAAAATLILVGCDDNPSNPGQGTDQTISSQLHKNGGNDLFSDSGSRERRRRDSLRIEGVITAVDTIAGTVTIGTRVIQTDSLTRIERNDAHVRLSAIQVGDKGQARIPAGSVVASKLEAEGAGGGTGGEELEIRGMVTAVDSSAGTLTIGTTLVQTNAQTRIERNHSQALLFEIQVGDRGEARIPAGSAFASRVEAESEHH
jgi:hypothetical protein